MGRKDYYPEQLYRSLDVAHEIGVAVSSRYYELPHQAYEARALSREYRLGFAGSVVDQIMTSDRLQQGSIHRAEALHLVSVPMVAESAPRDLVQLLIPPTEQLLDRLGDEPELHRYCALLFRTISLAASKLDNYTLAFHFMNRAQLYLRSGPQTNTSRATVAEVWQQIYLQECGQLARNVEAALLEQDPLRTARQLAGDLPHGALTAHLRPLRIAARAAAEAGRRGITYISAIKTEAGLPPQPDPERRRLATSSWFLTSHIMYMRALLLAALMEISAGADPSPYLVPVPSLWSTIIERNPPHSEHADPSLTAAHRMDMTRNALLWAFLNAGDHPYRPSVFGPARIREGVPDYLCKPVGRQTDTDACAAAIAAAGHDASILDNIAHHETYMILRNRSGSGHHSFEPWLHRRHQHLRAAIAHDPTTRQVRQLGKPTLRYLNNSVRMVELSRRYDNVLHGL